MSGPWRLIVDPDSDGAWNMAVDRAIQLARESDDVPPTLRVYGWTRPTVSLGRFQAVESVDAEECARRGFDVVRRSTGGRGVLHAHEVTYCVVASRADGVPGGVAASYAYLSRGLVEAYAKLGIPAQLTARDRGDAHSGACYLHTSRADLSIDGAKLAGSAQVWCGSTCLQHGSLVIDRDIDAEAAVFSLEDSAIAALRERARTIRDVLGRAPATEEVVAALVAGFDRVIGAGLAVGEYTRQELETASSLQEEMSILRATRA